MKDYSYTWAVKLGASMHPEEAKRIADHCGTTMFIPTIGMLYKHRSAQERTINHKYLQAILSSVGNYTQPVPAEPLDLPNPWASPVMLVKVEHITVKHKIGERHIYYNAETFEPEAPMDYCSICHFLLSDETVTEFNIFSSRPEDEEYIRLFNHWFRPLSATITEMTDAEVNKAYEDYSDLCDPADLLDSDRHLTEEGVDNDSE